MIQPRAAHPDPDPGEPFHGAKLFLTHGDRMLTCLRDDYAHIPYPDHWDLPGGGREASESPVACALRELHEEFGLTLPASRLHGRSFPSHHAPGMTSWLFSGVLDLQEIAAIRFGDEGQEWQMMPVERFIAHPRAVPHFRDRVRTLWQPPQRESIYAAWL
ncbi:MAG: NUDIX hydrolase [Paracoccus sp.]|nr:MAG: NUDIX hydrolase [Paracoccus sp. (in: a-proteobacteria)]